MYDPDSNNPYKQPSLPYESYRGYTNPPLSQPREFVPSSASAARANAPHNSYATPFRSSQSGLSQPRQPSAKPASPRISKAEALAFVSKCKKWLIAGSMITFGVLSGLVAGHVVGSTSTQSTTPAMNSPANSPNSPSSNGGFFQQQQQGGFGFGNSNLGQPPVSSSHTS